MPMHTKKYLTMNSVQVLSVAILALALFGVTAVVYGEIDGGLGSISKIVAKLCFGNHNNTIAEAFFACYDVAPGKELFAKCQEKEFGVLMNSEDNVTRTCQKIYKFPMYAICLATEFNATGIDLRASLDLINPCEAKVVGVN